MGFNPAVSRKALKAMGTKIRSWRLHRRVGQTLQAIASDINPTLRGWIAYYGRFNAAEMLNVFRHLEQRLARWARQKYKGMRRNRTKSWAFLRTMREGTPGLFEHWRALYTGRKGSMTRAV